MKTDIKTLSNGLRVIFIDTKAFPTITTLLLMGVGSRFETVENNGIAHFFEHMAFKGSKKYPDSFTISSTIEGLGGAFNAFTGKDRTGYWIKATRNHFNTMVDVISDMILHCKLEPEEIEKEKGVIREEINMYEDMPQRKVGEIFEELLYKGTPLGYDIAGKKEIVSGFTRKTFTDYIDTFYFPSNAALIVAGGINGEQEIMLKQIEDKLGEWKKGKAGTFKPYVDKQTSPQLWTHYKKTEQAHFCLGYRAFSLSSLSKAALSVLSSILGGGMSSRLFMEVREKRGLCYYISTGRELYKDVGNIVTQAGVTVDLPKIKEAMNVIIAQHNLIKTGIVKQDEMDRAKELIKGRLLLSMEDSSTVASFFGTKLILEDKIANLEEVLTQIDNVSLRDIQTVARELFINQHLNITLIGPIKQDELNISDLDLR